MSCPQDDQQQSRHPIHCYSDPVDQDLRGIAIVEQFTPQNLHVFGGVYAYSDLAAIDGPQAQLQSLRQTIQDQAQ